MSTQYQKISSDDEFLFSNDPLESKHTASSERGWRRMLRLGTTVALYTSAGLFAWTYYLHYSKKTEDYKMTVFEPMLNAVKYVDRKVTGIYKVFVDPPVDKLLPDMPKPPPGFLAPKTLVLDLKGTIISAQYVFGKGFEIEKRPGLTEFLGKLSQMYEVVLYSDEDFQFTQQVAQQLDPRQRVFSGRLGRESVCLRKGEVVKDLKYLNRDLKNVIVVEKNPEIVKYHPENVIILPAFEGDENDRALVELLPFLEHVAKDQIPDVREELERWGHYDTGKKYAAHISERLGRLQQRQQTGIMGMLQKKGTPQGNTGPVYDISDNTPKPSDLAKK